MTYEVVTVEEKTIAGVKERTSNLEEQEYEGAKIPSLWRAYFQSSILDPIPNEVPDTPPYAVYFNYEDGVRAKYDVLVGAEVSSVEGLSKEYASITLEGGAYFRFDAKGEMPLATVRLWEEIWQFFRKNSQHVRTFKTDFEVYTGEDEVSIYIGIQA